VVTPECPVTCLAQVFGHTPLLGIWPRNTGRRRRSNCGWNEGRFCKFNYLVNISIYPSICGSTDVCWTLELFQFLDLFTVGRTPWTSGHPVTRPLSTYRTPQTQNKRTQTSMPQMEFERTIPVFERAKTVHALGQAHIGSVFIRK
jgi:hypothetical protein